MNSSPLDIQTLAARVEKLEAANRRWKLSTTVLLLSGVSILLLGAKPAGPVAAATSADRIEPDVLHARSVEAQNFVLKDDEGHVLARLSLSPRVDVKKKGGTYLLPRDGALPGQAALQFYNDKGEVLWTAPSSAQLLPAR